MFNKIYSFIIKIFCGIFCYVNQILVYFQQEELSEKEVDYMVNDKLNKWITDQYSKNNYLCYIPQERKQLKRDEFRKELLKKYNMKYK